MADSLFFDGVDDFITFSAGNYVSTGALSMAFICKRDANSGADADRPMNSGISLFFDTTDRVHAFFSVADYPATNPTVTTADGWVLVAFTKASGSDAGDFHIYYWDTTTWIHDPGGTAIASPASAQASRFGGASGPANSFNGSLLIGGVWDSELSQATVETLINGQSAWVTADPAEAWRFDTLSSISSFTGTSTETARTGTTLDTGDAPAGWTDAEDTGLAWITA